MAHQHAQSIDPNDFTTHIDNPYMPLRPGTTFVYRDLSEHVLDTFVVTHHVKTINGVSCLVVHDTAWVDGELSENTRDYFAQDSVGNVWYFGEYSEQFEPGNPDPVGHEGSWRFGRHGAEPGIVMEANPQPGDFYHQENAPGIAEDQAKVVSLQASADVGYGQFNDLLKTKETNPLEPDDVEHKYYTRGIGNVLSTDNNGEFEQLVAIQLKGTSGDDRLLGYFGGDTILGGSGNDKLKGLRGDDKLDGGFGDDTMKGGSGADHFVFSDLPFTVDYDTILDYTAAEGDTLVIDGGAGAVVAETKVHHGWELTLNNFHTIKLVGVHDTDHDGHIVDQLIFG